MTQAREDIGVEGIFEPHDLWRLCAQKRLTHDCGNSATRNGIMRAAERIRNRRPKMHGLQIDELYVEYVFDRFVTSVVVLR